MSTPPTGPGAARLARGVTATWWYTVTAVASFEILLIFVWTVTLLATDAPISTILIVGIGGLIWCASTAALLFDYRHRADAPPGVRWTRLAAPMLVAAAFGIATGVLTGSWLLTLLPILQSLVLLNWPRGVRLRIVLAVTVVLGCMWVIDVSSIGVLRNIALWLPPAFYSTFLPIMTVTSLWWWDVLIALDRARTSEAHLAATQERLRVATDVHDLQGHHLQVIALQLELAERLMARDPDAALDQLQAARRSVDEARQGTRDLALRFRSVPLRDELANAADLLRAAGLTVETSLGADVDHAPAADLGPVIRETTTNVLRHGGGRRAQLTLARVGESWRYEIANDAVAGGLPAHDGSGLEGIGRRIREAGGTLDVQRGDEVFAVVVTVPARQEGMR